MKLHKKCIVISFYLALKISTQFFFSWPLLLSTKSQQPVNQKQKNPSGLDKH